ncbi:stalk domain-containing protein [Paenibacillus sp. GCM10012307]|uniref:DUF4163 domain-containing protein n=1 Tax=Paenibacillus roseus TaxID=2798579 RepID=A0A934J5F0_9BACL|nr:stalk domain-containing protein [Paenibacillus roseus]MBJ6360697.1 DUF4163 domain-containing protein [Paenibacillus roseus]
MNRKAGKQKKLMRWIAGPMAAAIVLGTVVAATPPLAGAKAYAASDYTIQFKVLNIKVNGQNMKVPGGISPDGDTYVGLRFLSDELGLTTTWDKKTKVVTVSSPTKTMTMINQSIEYKINGHQITGKPVVEMNNSTYLPLRFLLEQMGYEIGYSNKEQLVTITPIIENSLVLTNKRIDQSKPGKEFVIQYPQITGMSEPEAQAKINSFLEQEAEKYEQAGEDLYKEINDADVPKDGGLYYGVNYTITYNQNDRLSMHFDVAQYTGGAHGIYDMQSHTFDLKSGKEITLKEAAKNNSAYKHIINTEIKKQIKQRGYELLEPFESISDDQRFYLRGNAIIVYFSLYEYTPYALGIPEFSIPLDKF